MKKSIWKAIIHTTEIFLKFLYPPRCPVCDQIRKLSEPVCCPKCREDLPVIRQPFCMKCGQPIGYFEKEYCQDCSQTKHYFDQGIAPFTYSGQLRHAVYRMKSSNRRDYIPFFAEEMADACERYFPLWQPDVIVPVPMHGSRRRKRGYNQSELLARNISQLVGIPMDRELLWCTRRKTAQKTLDRKERRHNLQGSFAVRGQLRGDVRVLVVDDVYTTGSTMDEIAKTLKTAGAKYVFFVVLCTGKGKKTVCTAENLCYTKNRHNS